MPIAGFEIFQWLKKTLAVVELNIKLNMCYRTALLTSFVSSFLSLFLFLFLWRAVFLEGYEIAELGVGKILTYVVLSRIMHIHLAWDLIRALGQRIQSGEIASDFLRPVDIQLHWFLSRLTDLFFLGLVIGLPLLMIAYFIVPTIFPGKVLFFPDNASTWACFLLSLFLSVSLSFCLEFAIASLALYTHYSWGLEAVYQGILALCAGLIVPFEVLPEPVRSILLKLPFKEIFYTPLSIYLESIPKTQIATSLGIQLVWCVVFWLVSRALYLVLRGRVVVHGG